MSAKGAKVERVINKAQKQGEIGAQTHKQQASTEKDVAPMSNLPRHFKTADSGWDNAVELKRQLVERAGADGANTEFGQIQFTERDARALLDKKKAGEAAAFDGWFGERFNKNDLPTRILGEQLNPEYYEAREKALVDKTELALRIELMKLYGPRSEEDLMIIFGLDSGYLKLDDGWNVIGSPGKDVAPFINETRFKRDISSVSRFFAPQTDAAGGIGHPVPGTVAHRKTPFAREQRWAAQNTVSAPMFSGGGKAGNLKGFFDFLR